MSKSLCPYILLESRSLLRVTSQAESPNGGSHESLLAVLATVSEYKDFRPYFQRKIVREPWL